MPERTSYAEGTPNWVDLMSTDQQAAKDFYGSLFGWELDDQPTPQGPVYTMCRKDGKDVAGIGPLPPDMAAQGVPPMWNSYVAVDDVDATLVKAEGAGGAVMMPAMDVMEAGRMAGITDPTGAAVMIWQADQHIGAQLVNEHGALQWNELMTPDVPAAAEFYRSVFGWTSETADFGGVSYTSFNLGDRSIAGGMNPPMDGIPPNWGIYFGCDDTDALVASAQSLGATVMAEPNDIPDVGRLAALVDPQGAMFSVMKPARPTD